jgi:hypothetical protein
VSKARYDVTCRVGRLVEARVYALRSRADADAYGADVLAAARGCSPGKAPVLCADHRAAGIYPVDAADRLIELFRPNNSVFERIAILVSSANATLQMQLERLTREVGFGNRRVFREAKGAIEHLAPALDARELARARAFLHEVRADQ